MAEILDIDIFRYFTDIFVPKWSPNYSPFHHPPPSTNSHNGSESEAVGGEGRRGGQSLEDGRNDALEKLQPLFSFSKNTALQLIW